MTAGASGLTHGRARFRSLGLALVVLGFLFVAALVIGLSARVAQACDPVTGQGCDTTPAAPPSTAEPAPPQGGTQSPPATAGQPFIPPTSAPAAAPTTTLAPAPPTTASSPADQTSGSSSDFPWDWVAGGGAVAVAGTAAAGVAMRSRTKPDPLGDYTRACNDLCFAKQQEAQAEADTQAAQAELAQIDQAYFAALDYLDNQLRQEYLFQRKIHFLAGGMLILLPGMASLPFSAGAYLLGVAGSVGMGTGVVLTQDPTSLDPGAWNAQVNAAMQSAHGEIDRIHDGNRAPWQAKLDDARRRQNEAYNGVVGNDLRLAELRAANPDVAFPACGCEG